MIKFIPGRISPAILPHKNRLFLHLSNYLKSPSKPPPIQCNWKNWPMVWEMQLNDQIGDCTIAACDHQIKAWSAKVSAPVIVPEAETLRVYEALTGYNPRTGANDTGCVMSDVMKYWKTKGINGNKVTGSVSIDPSIINNVKWGTYLFGGVQFGINLPQSALDQSDAGAPWKPVVGSPNAGGHAINIVAYNKYYMIGVTWGKIQYITYPFISQFVEEVWASLDPYWFDNQGVSPVGLNIAQLTTDMNQL